MASVRPTLTPFAWGSVTPSVLRSDVRPPNESKGGEISRTGGIGIVALARRRVVSTEEALDRINPFQRPADPAFGGFVVDPLDPVALFRR